MLRWGGARHDGHVLEFWRRQLDGDGATGHHQTSHWPAAHCSQSLAAHVLRTTTAQRWHTRCRRPLLVVRRHGTPRSLVKCSQSLAHDGSRRVRRRLAQPGREFIIPCTLRHRQDTIITITITTRSNGTVHTSVKARLSSVAIRIRIRDPDRHQNLTICLMAYWQSSLKIPCKSIWKFLRKLLRDKQTDNDENITFLADVITIITIWQCPLTKNYYNT